MAMIPAVCSNCGAVFGTTNAIGGEAANVTLSNVSVGPCPNCGGMGQVPDGVYNLRADTLEVVQSAGVAPNVLQGIVGMLEALQRGEASKDQVIAEVAREAPALRETVERTLSSPNAVQWIAILINIILSIIAMSNQGPSAQEIAEEIRPEPIPTYPATSPEARRPEQKASPKKRNPGGKAFGKNKRRKSKKRR